MLRHCRNSQFIHILYKDTHLLISDQVDKGHTRCKMCSEDYNKDDQKALENLNENVIQLP